MKNFFYYLFFSLLILSSCQTDSSKQVENDGTLENNNVYTHSEVDVLPRFPGCENQSEEKKIGCASSKMFNFLRENVKYPKLAKEEGKEGRAVVSFVVDKSGKIRDVEVVKDPGNEMGKEAKRVIEKFPTWVPGLLEGNKVNVKFILPVTFKL